MAILRRAAFKISPCLSRINGAGKHAFPVNPLPGSAHAVVDVSGTGNALRQVGCMGCNFGSNDAVLDILCIRQTQVFCWCDIAEEVCPIGSCNGTADGRGDVIVSRIPIWSPLWKRPRAPTSMWVLRMFTLRSPALSPARSALTCW